GILDFPDREIVPIRDVEESTEHGDENCRSNATPQPSTVTQRHGTILPGSFHPDYGRKFPTATVFERLFRYSASRNDTRSCFSALVSFSRSTRLKNSTVSSSVKSRSSCRYGGVSLIPRRGKVLIGPSAEALRPLIVVSLKNRSARRLCIRLSV